MAVIVDASVALSWAMPDERTEATLALLEAAQADDIIVPGHFRTEVANGLRMAEPRRISQAEITQFVNRLGSLSIIVDHEGSDMVFERILPRVAPA